MGYAKVGTIYYDYFVYSTTGLTQSDFTIQVDKNGVAGSTTGVTIAEIGSTRSYVVTVDPTSGFVSATGTYNLQIYRTSVPNDRWNIVVRVTNDGSAGGSTGITGFTSSTNNGRITDGTNPLQYASIVILRPSGGGYYTSLVSDATGNWGPVYFDTDGVFTFTAQVSGYSVGSGSITVTSGVPSGPGTDIELTVTSASSGVTLSALKAYARRMYRDRTGSKADAELVQAVNEALMMVSTSKDWTWYETIGNLTFRAVYTTGTVAISNGSTTVTLTGGTFPYTTVGVDGVADIYINGMPHRLASITNGTTAVLAYAWQETSYNGTYSLAQTEYTLPSDLVKLSRITSVSTWVWGPEPVSRYDLEIARQQWRLSSTQPPRMWAIERDRLCIWPAPSADQMVNLLYLRRPADLSGPTDVADWDPNLTELLHRAIDYQVACRGDCVAGDKAATLQSYKESMARNIDQGRKPTVWTPGVSRDASSDFRYGATIVS